MRFVQIKKNESQEAPRFFMNAVWCKQIEAYHSLMECKKIAPGKRVFFLTHYNEKRFKKKNIQKTVSLCKTLLRVTFTHLFINRSKIKYTKYTNKNRMKKSKVYHPENGRKHFFLDKKWFSLAIYFLLCASKLFVVLLKLCIFHKKSCVQAFHRIVNALEAPCHLFLRNDEWRRKIAMRAQDMSKHSVL